MSKPEVSLESLKDEPEREQARSIARLSRKGGTKSAGVSVPEPTKKGSPETRGPDQWVRNEVETDEAREVLDHESENLAKSGVPTDMLAEELGEEYVRTATSGQQAAEEARDEEVPEERGGPFVETSAATEFAAGTDPSNPADGDREAFPESSTEPSDARRP
jgi:hypothetical protein